MPERLIQKLLWSLADGGNFAFIPSPLLKEENTEISVFNIFFEQVIKALNLANYIPQMAFFLFNYFF